MSDDSAEVRWIHGSEDCLQSPDPPLQVHRLDEDTFILRQSKCLTFEAPFLYLLAGEDQALLLDTGAIASPQEATVESTVRRLLRQRQQERGDSGRSLPLLVVHSHGHGDHREGDSQFAGRPDVRQVGPGVATVRDFFAIPDWPDGQGMVDLGDRTLDVLPIPGHTDDHIVLYDRRTGILLTGDTLYPGLLVVNDLPAYRQSAVRLARFARENPVALVLGCHIEMKRTPPGELFPIAARAFNGVGGDSAPSAP